MPHQVFPIHQLCRLINQHKIKIEFEIINTCYTIDLNKKKFTYLNKDEKNNYLKQLKNLTNNIILNQKKTSFL